MLILERIVVGSDFYILLNIFCANYVLEKFDYPKKLMENSVQKSVAYISAPCESGLLNNNIFTQK